MAISLPYLLNSSVCGVLFAVLWEKHNKFYFDHFSPMHHGWQVVHGLCGD